MNYLPWICCGCVLVLALLALLLSVWLIGALRDLRTERAISATLRANVSAIAATRDEFCQDRNKLTAQLQAIVGAAEGKAYNVLKGSEYAYSWPYFRVLMLRQLMTEYRNLASLAGVTHLKLDAVKQEIYNEPKTG